MSVVIPLTSKFGHVRFITAIALVMTLSSVVMAAAAPGEFQPDENTLLLAHFGCVEKADYAQGLSLFAGNGARLTEGYYGNGIDLRWHMMDDNFLTRCNDYTPYYNGWGFHARGNVDPAQGTFECWFRTSDPETFKLPWGVNFLSADLNRPVKNPKNPDSYVGASIVLKPHSFQCTLPTVAGDCLVGEVNFKGIPGFERKIAPADWHHFALTWSQGETVIWLDGRPLLTFDMKGQLGLVLLDNPGRYISMSDCIIDELRISNTVRYNSPYEPNWRGGKRPDYAFTGNPAVKRHEQKLLEPPKPRLLAQPPCSRQLGARLGVFELAFAQENGRMSDFRVSGQSGLPSSNGLLLHRGLERQLLEPVSVRGWQSSGERVFFEQAFEGDITAANELTVSGGALVWKVTLTNSHTKESWLEPLMSIPLPSAKTEEFFDGCEQRRELLWPRHRDEFCLTLPFVAASGAEHFTGVGLNPHTDLNDIVGEWIPAGESGIIRQGTKLALAPGESFTLEFSIVHGASDFGTLDAIDAFHARFPDLYRIRPDVPVYSYMPATQDFAYSKSMDMDMKRMGYAGGLWGHGPSHDKGDEYGTEKWWGNPKFMADRHYSTYTSVIEKRWTNPDTLRRVIPLTYRQAFDNYYPARRFHTCPDLTPAYIINELWPGHAPNNDPLGIGQYYGGKNSGEWLVNEYNTPLGEHFREQTRKYFTMVGKWCPGYINDMSHAGALNRCNDQVARQTPGRSFSRDLGAFVRKSMGRKQRYEILNNWITGGHRASFWSDGGIFSYTLAAYSASCAIEGDSIYSYLTGSAEYAAPGRWLAGEKPFTSMTHINDDWTGYNVKPEMFTPEKLRDLYRYCDTQLSLFCLEYGITLDPTSYMWGRQDMWERAPVMVESTVLGRKIIPAARVKGPLWLRRAGNAHDTFMIVGNRASAAEKTDMRIVNRYFGGAPLMAAYYGGTTEHSVTADTTVIPEITVEPRGFAAFKAVAILNTPGTARAETRFSGNGITLELDINLDAPAGGEILISQFGPAYQFSSLTLNGTPVRKDAAVPVPRTPARILATYHARSLDFNADDWAAVELIKDGRTNFRIISSRGVDVKFSKPVLTYKLGFERGTAEMLSDFILQYDSEDGVPGNLTAPEFASEKSGKYEGWSVLFSEDRITRPGRVRIDTGLREIRIEGATQGEMRRAMVMLMRLTDRKYPHVGRFYPMLHRKQFYEAGKPVPFDKWVIRNPTREFFEKFSDRQFLVKPILRKEYEHLYRDSNMDFAGKYGLKWSPYLFEPTYGDDFVYGYSGPGAAPEERISK